DNEEDYQAEIVRVKKEVDIANQLGIKFMRHDVASRPIPETTIQQFEADLPQLIEACREIADYANQYGIITSVENHGYYIQASDRVQSLVSHVDRPNFKTTLDIGNFLCVD
ncbi:TIM barrel protein, partial [Microvirga sp. 3-52]|nr:TIM barrel protein [Microvirga sp. 3-52]